MAEDFNDPHVTINRVYTRKGDSGMTSLVGGHRVSKHHTRIETYGTVDELNAIVGMARVSTIIKMVTNTMENGVVDGVMAEGNSPMPMEVNTMENL